MGGLSLPQIIARLAAFFPPNSPNCEAWPQAKFTINCYIPSVEVMYSGLTEA